MNSQKSATFAGLLGCLFCLDAAGSPESAVMVPEAALCGHSPRVG